MRVLIAGGGTAGHIYPGIALAKQLLKTQPESEILFVGTERGMESEFVPREGFKIEFIRVTGFKRRLSFGTIKTFFKMFDGYSDAKKILKKFKPDIVIGMGGYVCGPVLMAAYFKRIPTIIHEQNALPGVTNKLLSRFVKVVCISYEESRKFFKSAKRIVLTGNPIRAEFSTSSRLLAREQFGLLPGEKFVAIMGGSLGSEKINSAVVSLIENHYNAGEFKILFATGTRYFDAVIERLTAGGKQLPDGISVERFIEDAPTVFAAADLIVCRAGAITLSELAFMGMPSILVPSPNVAANHQVHNALTLQKLGAAHVLVEGELSGASLTDALRELLANDSVRIKMGRQIQTLSRPDAARLLESEVLRLLKKE